jgi:HEAT repeat protein
MNMRVFASLFSLFGAFVPLGAPAQSTPRPANFRVAVSSDKTEYMLGENVLLTFTVENTGTESFRVEFGGDTRGTSRAISFSVSAVDRAGTEMPDPQPEQLSFGGFVFPSNLAPGQKRDEKLGLHRYRRITAPGLYRITVSHPCGWSGEPKDRPTAMTEISFRLPTETEAGQLVASLLERANRPIESGKPREWVDFTALQHPVFLRPLLAAAKAGNPGAISGVASIPTRDATVGLLELAQEMEGKNGALAASLIPPRLPPVIFPGVPSPPSSFPAEVWDESLREQTVRVGIQWLAAKNPAEAAAGAGILRRVAGASEARWLLENLAAVLGEIGEARTARAEPGHYPGSVPSLLEIFTGMRTRGWTLPLSDATDNATKVAFLDGYRMKPLPRPDGFENFALECLTNKNAVVREAALWALPRPMSAAAKEPVLRMLSDPDSGVQRAARFASEQREHFTSEQVQAEQNRIMETFKSDPLRMMEEMSRFSSRVLDASLQKEESKKRELLPKTKTGE